MQLFLAGYLLISICEIFSVGGVPVGENVRIVSAWCSPCEAWLALGEFFD
ncbi:hypothetical protein IMZ48_48550 [Candidatus Bathyarchaeota archaeon]|nr:hypothetical protein [Candidatus Bathyarchaeota archaeon]